MQNDMLRFEVSIIRPSQQDSLRIAVASRLPSQQITRPPNGTIHPVAANKASKVNRGRPATWVQWIVRPCSFVVLINVLDRRTDHQWDRQLDHL